MNDAAQAWLAELNDPEISGLVSSLLQEIHGAVGSKLVGLYLHGSLVTGDFDRRSSDIDLLAVTASDVDSGDFERLDAMHDAFAHENREWDGRVEVAYLSVEALKTFREVSSRIAAISPGEPFHMKEAGKDWLMNWYVVREKGIALFGPPPSAFIGPISREEFVQSVLEYAKGQSGWVEHAQNRPSQAYAILTMCRALYAFRNGEQVSKKQAALWAGKQLPEWSPLIENALRWREAWRDPVANPAATLPQAIRFVRYVSGLIGTSDPRRARTTSG